MRFYLSAAAMIGMFVLGSGCATPSAQTLVSEAQGYLDDAKNGLALVTVTANNYITAHPLTPAQQTTYTNLINEVNEVINTFQGVADGGHDITTGQLLSAAAKFASAYDDLTHFLAQVKAIGQPGQVQLALPKLSRIARSNDPSAVNRKTAATDGK